MSYNLLVDLNDLPGIQQNFDHPPRRSTINNRKFNLVAYISRTLCIRRLKYLKFYMALMLTFLILFFLLKPSPVTLDNHVDESNSLQEDTNLADGQSMAGIGFTDKLKTIARSTKIPHLTISPQFEHSDLTDQSTLVNNLTFFLTMGDFYKMKNINVMQVRIREAMKHSWDNYRRYAWGKDMLKPRSKEPDHWFDLGLTIVDAADTLVMMGLTNEANLAIDWIENDLNFTSNNENSNCFEMTIRILAGILSVYHLTTRNKLKYQAVQMGDILMHCYNTESKVIPYSDIDLNTRRAHPPQWNPLSSLSEVASLQLEFRYLSQISGNISYEQISFKTSVHLHNLTTSRRRKLLPMYLNPNTGQLEDSIITLGARTDSYYEYLLKQYLQRGVKWLEDDYLDCIDEVARDLLRHTDGADNYTYVAEMQIYKTTNDTEDIKHFNKMDHLVCFLPGTLILGYYHFSPLAAEYRLKYNLETPQPKINPRYNGHLKMAQVLGRTCYHMYSKMGTGLAPEIATFVHSQNDDPLVQNQPELQVQSTAAHNLLRPEFVESLFYLYHITGLPIYRKQASLVFDAFEKYSRIPSGYTPISDVRQKPPAGADLNEWLYKNAPDRMESFWLGETLKYLYLIFCDDRHIVGTLLNNYVFNTEAHMIPIL